MLAQYKKRLTSRQHVAAFAVATWRDVEEGGMPGVDVMLTSREGRRKIEVRLRLLRGEVVGEVGRETLGGEKGKGDDAGEGDSGDEKRCSVV